MKTIIYSNLKKYLLFICVVCTSLYLSGCNDSDDVIELSEDMTDSISTDEDTKEIAGSSIFIYICGEIKNPGVYEMPAQSRVYELVNRAGGFTARADSEAVNQAECLVDSQKVVIPARNKDTSSAYAAKSDGLININTAGADELQAITGIGQKRANDIVEYREKNGPFSSVEDITKVPGIKGGTFSKIKEQITV